MKDTAYIISLLLMLVFAATTHAQEVALEVLPANELSRDKTARLNYPSRVADKSTARTELHRVLEYFYEKGYLAASFDSVVEDSAKVSGYINVGEIYSMTVIRPGNIPAEILRQSGYREKLYRDRAFSPAGIKKLYRKIITSCENNGYPFAMVKLDSITLGSGNTIAASLNLTKNQRVSIDTVMVKGSSGLHPKFIRNYFNIRQGDLYNESRIRKINARLQDLPFVTEVRPHEVVFIDDEAKLILYLDKKRASQFDGILGIAPNDDVDGKLLLTGDIQLKLLNAFNRGELIDFNWRKLEAKSQDLKFRFNFPFLFNTPFGLDYKLHLYKKDTSYLTLSNKLGIQVLFNGYNHVMAFYENQMSNLLSTEGLEFVTTLPEYADINTSLYGLGMDYSRLNYRYNPRRGFRFELTGAIGSKKIRKNANVNPAIYDSIPLSSTLYRLQFDGAGFIPLFRNSTLMVRNQSGFLENENLFENELFRIGGLKTLRGFDEESLSASTYTIITIEFRYLFDLNSYFNIFFDGAWYEQNTASSYFNDMPYGIGAGVNFETRAGIFSLSYAMGSRDGQPLQFKAAKIHFGLTARF